MENIFKQINYNFENNGFLDQTYVQVLRENCATNNKSQEI